MAAELDNGRLVEESSSVKKQADNSRADEPAAHATQLALRACDKPLLIGGVLRVQWRKPIVI